MKWIIVALLSMLGLYYTARGVTALAQGKELAILLKYGYPVNPSTTILIGVTFLFGALYAALVRKKSGNGGLDQP